MPNNADAPAVGILMLETDFPRIPGDIGNPETFPYPVRYRVVEGASVQRVVRQADPSLLGPFIQAARDLERQGVRVLFTSCGFLAIFQRELAESVDIPVYTSALVQVADAWESIAQGRTVGIITAERKALTPRHFQGLGIGHVPNAIVGMETAAEFSSVFLGGKPTLDVQRCRTEMAEATRKLMAAYPQTGAIVLECTNMPPYREVVCEVSRLPVLDVLTLMEEVVARLGLYPHCKQSGKAFA